MVKQIQRVVATVRAYKDSKTGRVRSGQKKNTFFRTGSAFETKTATQPRVVLRFSCKVTYCSKCGVDNSSSSF